MLFEKVVDIFKSKKDQLDELMEIAGGNPKTFWIGTNFRACDFGKVNVAGWCFHAANLEGCNLSRVKDIDKATFTADTRLAGAILPKGFAVTDLVMQPVPKRS